MKISKHQSTKTPENSPQIHGTKKNFVTAVSFLAQQGLPDDKRQVTHSDLKK
jgi:hypothetical protein